MPSRVIEKSTRRERETRTGRAAESRRRVSSPQGRWFRAELVERVRREISAGEYETPHRIDGAIRRLITRLERDQG
jgi:anti-sigma28 factor (negative regulator of flagellin synthesis)